uniref:Uncharacterized protein n=1 Tax=Meloidogyne incognita TaxID=6306 RepID=A0A914NK43_MELIC
MTEEARRLLYLAIREGKLERRVKISARLRQAMCEELSQMRNRLCRLLTGEESRSRQLAFENEAKIFELARLQNALLHSVPLNEYNRLLREHKRILRERFLTYSPDIGYYSATNSSLKTNSEDEEESEYIQLNKINISKSGLLFGDNENINKLLLKNKKLEEINEILIGQNESLKAEKRKTETELAEMNAFLDDLEAETELKSMLANIERRFLHAIREQFDATEERESLQNELRRIEPRRLCFRRLLTSFVFCIFLVAFILFLAFLFVAHRSRHYITGFHLFVDTVNSIQQKSCSKNAKSLKNY